jgi:hypothetical protein
VSWEACLYRVDGEWVFLCGRFCVVVRFGLCQLLSSGTLSLSLSLLARFQWSRSCGISGGMSLSELFLSVGGGGEVGSSVMIV